MQYVLVCNYRVIFKLKIILNILVKSKGDECKLLYSDKASINIDFLLEIAHFCYWKLVMWNEPKWVCLFVKWATLYIPTYYYDPWA